MPFAPGKMQDAIVSNHYQKTGKTPEEWIQVTKEPGAVIQKERTEWLKTYHNQGYAAGGMVAFRTGRNAGLSRS